MSEMTLEEDTEEDDAKWSEINLNETETLSKGKFASCCSSLSKMSNKVWTDSEFDELVKSEEWINADFGTRLNFVTTPNLTYTWNNLAASVSVRTTLTLTSFRRVWRGLFNKDEVFLNPTISPICGVACSGEILAVIDVDSGGCGNYSRTTLLNILSFRHSCMVRMEGERCINGIPVDRRFIHEISSYVKKVDHNFIPLVTVEEHLVFTIMLRGARSSSSSSSRVTFEQTSQQVQQTLAKVGLWEKRNLLIGPPSSVINIDENSDALSKGEQKLLAIICEMLTEPKILFCECPTAGLDAVVSKQIMTLLSQFCAKGNIVIVSVESGCQEMFSFYDKLYIMTSGRMAFHGTPQQALRFWSTYGLTCPRTHNPIDFFIRTLQIVPEQGCLEKTYNISRSYQKSVFFQNVRSEVTGVLRSVNSVSSCHFEKELFRKTSRYRANWCRQLYWLYMRESSIMFRSTLPFYGIFFVSIISSLFYGLVFWGQKIDDDGARNITTFFAVAVFHTLLFSSSTGTISMGKYLKVIYSETFKRTYRSSSYFVAKNLCDLPVYTIFPWIFVLISFPMVGIGTDLSSPSVFFAIVSLSIASNAACSLGYMYLMLLGSAVFALQVTHSDIIHFVFYSGILICTDASPYFVGLIHNYSVSYQVMENLMAKQWEDVGQVKVYNYSGGNISMHFHSGQGVLNFYKYDQNEFITNCVALVGVVTILFRTFTFILLVIRVYLNRKFYPHLL